jgi:hypothetical protein
MGAWQLIRQLIRPDPMASELWDCDPLVVVDENDEIAFAARARVECRPLSNGRFHLTSENGRDDWLPKLVEAERFVPLNVLQTESMIGYDLMTRGRRRGAAFRGKDAEGLEFTWYINDAADQYVSELAAIAAEEKVDQG